MYYDQLVGSFKNGHFRLTYNERISGGHSTVHNGTVFQIIIAYNYKRACLEFSIVRIRIQSDYPEKTDNVLFGEYFV